MARCAINLFFFFFFFHFELAMYEWNHYTRVRACEFRITYEKCEKYRRVMSCHVVSNQINLNLFWNVCKDMSIHRTSAQPVKMERLTFAFLLPLPLLWLLLLYTHACCDPEVCFDFIYSLVIIRYFFLFFASSSRALIVYLLFAWCSVALIVGNDDHRAQDLVINKLV